MVNEPFFPTSHGFSTNIKVDSYISLYLQNFLCLTWLNTMTLPKYFRLNYLKKVLVKIGPLAIIVAKFIFGGLHIRSKCLGLK